MTQPIDDIHLLTGAYAVDALDEVERRRFENHLEDCATCRTEVRSLLETAALLGGGAAATPPAGLRDSVLAAVARTPQAAPSVSPGFAATLDAGRAGGPVPPSRPVGAWRRWGAGLVAAAAVVGAVSYGAVQHQRAADLGTQLSAAEARVAQASAASNMEDDLMGMLANPTSKIANTNIAGGGHVVAVVTGQQVMLMGGGLKAPTPGTAYQLWEITGSTMVSQGMMTPAADGSFAMVKDFHGGAWAVTLEPSKGSAQPTSDPLFMVSA
ncbi:anti-sigma factor [Micrococcales bacterium 31B]|nr:anti-sigma factor [Micrococcales bacterium 31B]